MCCGVYRGLVEVDGSTLVAVLVKKGRIGERKIAVDYIQGRAYHLKLFIKLIRLPVLICCQIANVYIRILNHNDWS